ncbi:hypothetical protein AB0D45_02835 [Streptomyces sp. NPDC048352]|uniref:hypothetical protein n=1 Tax=Streptomyces sp. NPDC048352 TaxID=3154718 RepID=UPI003448281E
MAMRSPYRAATDHHSAAEAARAQRGTWVLAGVFSSTMSAKTAARLIRTGSEKYVCYQPAGAFEAYAIPTGDEVTVWVRYVAGEEPVPPLPDRMTVRIRHDGDGPGYSGVGVVTVTISTRCPACGGPRGWETVRPHHFHHDGDQYTVDRWTNPCGHTDMYVAVLRESRDRQLPPPRPAPPEQAAPPAEDGPVALVLAAAASRRGMHAKQAALLLEEHGHGDAAALIRAELKERRGHMSAKGAASFLRDLARPIPDSAASSTTTRNVP